MRKIAMTLAGMLFVGLAAANAQTDSTRKTRPAEEPMEQVSPTPSQSQYRSADRVTVPADQVPSSLRQTLQGSQYKGWETTPLYQDRRSQEYYFEMPDANGTTKRMYRFDRNGKAISGSDMSSPKSNDGTTPSSTPQEPGTQPKP
ncbi:hypothetical protein [Pseudochryseolinea flava]|nr:hypothetical protein [Pseudochryseolinea flava]